MNTTQYPICSKLAHSHESANNDTNIPKEYEVTLNFTQHCQTTVIIKAVSLTEAEEKANDIEADEVDDWTPFDGEISVLDVEPVEGGQDND